MKNSGSNKYKILVLGPELHMNGGVADFCKMLLKGISTNFSVRYLSIGNITQKEKILSAFYKLSSSLIILYKFIKTERYHLIQLNPSFKIKALPRDSAYLIFTMIAARTCRKIVFFHGWDESLATKIGHISIFRSLVAALYNRVDRIYVLYQTCKSQLINIGVSSDRITVTTTTYDGKIVQTVNLKDQKSNSDLVHILYLSRFAKQKGVMLTAKICSMLEMEGIHNFHLAMAGDGELYRELEEYVNQNNLNHRISLEGFVTGRKKRDLLQRSDILLFPTSYGEGCPIVVLEAMGAGLAVISTPKGALPSIITDGVNGFLIDSNQARDFIIPLKSLLTDKELLEQIKQQNSKYAETMFESSAYFRRMTNEYCSLIEN